MKILALDSATEACSVALLVDGHLEERFEIAPRGHASLLLPYIDALLREAGLALSGLDAVAVSRGPGSFTGIRIGFSLAQGLAVGAGLGLMPVSTLHALALAGYEQAPSPTCVLAVLDARMGEVYAGSYDFATVALGHPGPVSECVADPESVPLPGGEWQAAGPGAGRYEAILRRRGRGLRRVAPEVLPRASGIARIAAAALAGGSEAQRAEAVHPVYLRQRVAEHPH